MQTRLATEISVNGLAALAGLKIKLPIEVARAEGKLADIRCYGSTPQNASVTVEAVPGVVEIAIGTVHPSVLSNFSNEARVEKVRLVDSALLKIDGIAHVETKNMQPERLTFSSLEVAGGGAKSVSTKDILTSTTQTLLNNLDAYIQVRS
ncbi:MAG: hypothetical protein AAAC47_21645 [Pararhizobium sp.]